MKNKKVLVFSLLVIVLFGLGIGFAAFSSRLTITSSAEVNPSSSDFKVRFSSAKDSFSSADVVPVVSGGATAENAKLPGGTVLITYPSAQGVTFTDSGQNASYNFYVRNDGQYTAYLNSIEFRKSSSGEFKNCEKSTGSDATSSLVEAACDAISIEVRIFDESTGAAKTTTTGLTNIDDFPIEPGEVFRVRVLVRYAEDGALADGPFFVTFGDIVFNYSTVD